MEDSLGRYISLTDNWTKHDVIVYYKGAKNKIEEVDVLAQLTGSDVDTILEILKDAGVYKGAYHICASCGQQFPSIYKKMKNPLCPKCRKVGNEIAKLEWKLKRNIAKMEQLARENGKLRKEIEEISNGR